MQLGRFEKIAISGLTALIVGSYVASSTEANSSVTYINNPPGSIMTSNQMPIEMPNVRIIDQDNIPTELSLSAVYYIISRLMSYSSINCANHLPRNIDIELYSQDHTLLNNPGVGGYWDGENIALRDFQIEAKAMTFIHELVHACGGNERDAYGFNTAFLSALNGHSFSNYLQSASISIVPDNDLYRYPADGGERGLPVTVLSYDDYIDFYGLIREMMSTGFESWLFTNSSSYNEP